MTARMSIITDWRVRDESTLPDLAPGEEYERAIAPQKFGVVLRRIIVRGPSLIRLRIGAVPDVPFELENVDGEIRHYRPKSLDDEVLKKHLAKAGAAPTGPNAIAIYPGIDVWLVLRNEGNTPTKPRAALLVQEETT